MTFCDLGRYLILFASSVYMCFIGRELLIECKLD